MKPLPSWTFPFRIHDLRTLPCALSRAGFEMGLIKWPYARACAIAKRSRAKTGSDSLRHISHLFTTAFQHPFKQILLISFLIFSLEEEPVQEQMDWSFLHGLDRCAGRAMLSPTSDQAPLIQDTYGKVDFSTRQSCGCVSIKTYVKRPVRFE